ncbi:CDP-diacylglycerol--glycerol-3-phosphate 3-phosphatidyltransferase [Pasteuria penetrans]|uniref:CDP-diacylglycerol--glycerol-3-phosphate 3-phosphatidyltransferase n=1 Tax=Pasteuria penetrans TaxID=86005 RepID=UPI0011F08F95|nr:CDP-diacylglycerol--glycerol-3-phosphate 3-phosphatidyltransferase [Pasteuria penetrans]
MNLANQLTLLRILLVPPLVLFLLMRPHLGFIPIGGWLVSVGDLLATFLFLVAACTDGLDGYIARKRGAVTRLGKFLDPLADKLLITAVLIQLVEIDRVEAWMAIMIISREFAVMGLRLVAAAEGKMVVVHWLGKWKTLVQIVAVGSLMLDNTPFSWWGFPFADYAMWLAVIVTLISGFYYFYKNRKLVMM